MFIKESALLNSLINAEKKYKVPIFNFGKKQNAFTIEESELVITTAVFKMPFMRRLFCKLAGIFFDVSKFYLWSKDIASRMAINNLQGMSKGYDYYLNYKINVMLHPGGYYIAEATATGLKLYKDTLGLFQVPSDVLKFKPSLKRMHLVRNLFRNIIVLTLVMLCMMMSFHILEQKVIASISLDDEHKMWSAMSHIGVIKNRLGNPNLIEGENKINAILSKVSFSKKLSKYKFEAFIIDDNEADLHLLPAGKIVLTKGLLKLISSEQELMFIILDAIGHYENRSHIKVLGQNIITPYYIYKLLGYNNFLTSFAFNYAGFFEQSYPSDEELQSNEFALIQLDRIYNDIGNISVFDANVLEEDSPYIDTHPIIKENLMMLKKAHHLDEGSIIPLELNLDKPAIHMVTNKISGVSSPEPFGSVEEDLNEIYTNYNDAIRPLLDVLEPMALTTREGIASKLEVVEYGHDVVDYFEYKFAERVVKTKKYVEEYFAASDNQEQARFDKVTLMDSIDDFRGIMSFYFDRDLSIFKLQKSALKFLSERVGTYTVENGGFVFKSQYEQNNFNTLINRINELARQKPKLKTDKWSNYG